VLGESDQIFVLKVTEFSDAATQWSVDVGDHSDPVNLIKMIAHASLLSTSKLADIEVASEKLPSDFCQIEQAIVWPRRTSVIMATFR
jgi:hypothetical protein